MRTRNLPVFAEGRNNGTSALSPLSKLSHRMQRRRRRLATRKQVLAHRQKRCHGILNVFWNRNRFVLCEP